MATLLPEGKQSFTNSAGAPLVGGKVYTYDAGTSTPRTTYQDAAGTVPNANPVILDARGEATIFWNGAYKVILKDALDVTIWTIDGLQTPSTDTTLRADLAATTGAALSGWKQSGASAVNRTVDAKLKEWASAADFGAAGVSTATDTTAINAGIAAVHAAGGGILRINNFISTAIDLTTLANQSDVMLFDERYKTAGHVAYFNTGTDAEVRVQGASLSSGEGPSFVMQNNALAGDRTGSLVARWGPMGSTKVNSYFHFGVWDGAAWTPDLDWLGNGAFGGVDDFRSRFRMGAAGALILNPAGTGKNIDAATAKAAGYTMVVNRPTPPGGGALQYQFGIRDGAVEIPQELQITSANATIRFQNAAGANKWGLLGEFPSAGQFCLYDSIAGGNKMVLVSGGDNVITGVWKPSTDNTVSLGTATNRWSVVYAGTGAINTSDEREKTLINGVPDKWLDAWAEVQWSQFKMKDSVEAKGESARWHVGLVAQQIKVAFENHGLDALSIGVLCLDQWEDEYVDHPDMFEDSELLDLGGQPIKRLVRPAYRELVRAAGDRWGVRYDEAQSLEAAYIRRELARMKGV